MAKTLVYSADTLTNNVSVDDNYHVTGEGIFDKLMATATTHLQAQFDANRIRQEDYAVAYVDIYKASLTAALTAWTTTAQVAFLEAQIAKVEAETELTEQQTVSEKAKEKLYYRQIEGFDENYKEKMLKIMLDSWSVGFSVSASTFTEIPNPMTKAVIDRVWDDYMKDDFDYSTKESNTAGPRVDDNTKATESITPTTTTVSNSKVTYTTRS